MKLKKLILFIIIISVLLILSGCSDAGISLKISPNPVEFSKSQTKRDITLEVKTEGLGSINLNKMIVEVINEDDESIYKDEKSIDISNQFIVGGFSKEVDYTLDLKKIFKLSDYDSYDTFPLLYQGLLKGKTHTLRITVTGSNNTSLTAQIKYN